MKESVSRDHAHLLVSVPPTLSVFRLGQHMKGQTTRKFLMENCGLNKAFLREASVGPRLFRGEHGERSEISSRYIENQQDMERDQDADFKVEPRCRPPIGFSRRAQTPRLSSGG